MNSAEKNGEGPVSRQRERREIIEGHFNGAEGLLNGGERLSITFKTYQRPRDLHDFKCFERVFLSCKSC
jgi:hypothetical protein